MKLPSTHGSGAVSSASGADAVHPPAPKRPLRQLDSAVPNYIDLGEAQKTSVVHFPGVLGTADLKAVLAYHRLALDAGDPLETNPQNRSHQHKRCTFLSGASAPHGGLVSAAPRVLAKLLRAALSAKEQAGWGRGPQGEGEAADGASAGPLADIDIRQLSIRVVELWEYQPGGGLVDDLHFDAMSIVTVVCLVNDSNEFTGGVFRTFEADGSHLEHEMGQGDVVCFVSHKYHNVTPVLTGRRVSLVVELWEGGNVPNFCR